MIASAVCASGHRLYVFKREDTGAWETQADRRERLRGTLVCAECKNAFEIPIRPVTYKNERLYCNRCIDEKLAAACRKVHEGRKLLAVKNRENSARSPWRIGTARIRG